MSARGVNSVPVASCLGNGSDFQLAAVTEMSVANPEKEATLPKPGVLDVSTSGISHEPLNSLQVISSLDVVDDDSFSKWGFDQKYLWAMRVYEIKKFHVIDHYSFCGGQRKFLDLVVSKTPVGTVMPAVFIYLDQARKRHGLIVNPSESSPTSRNTVYHRNARIQGFAKSQKMLSADQAAADCIRRAEEEAREQHRASTHPTKTVNCNPNDRNNVVRRITDDGPSNASVLPRGRVWIESGQPDSAEYEASHGDGLEFEESENDDAFKPPVGDDDGSDSGEDDFDDEDDEESAFGSQKRKRRGGKVQASTDSTSSDLTRARSGIVAGDMQQGTTGWLLFVRMGRAMGRSKSVLGV